MYGKNPLANTNIATGINAFAMISRIVRTLDVAGRAVFMAAT